MVVEVIEVNLDKVVIYRKGKKGFLGFFMGEVMKRFRGKVEFKLINVLLCKMLDS